MRLDGEQPETVYVFQSQGESPVRLAFSASRPYRLFCDLNGDNECQAEELFSTSDAGSRTRRFAGVKFPLRVGEVVRIVHVDVHLYRTFLAEVCDFKSDYAGTVTLGGADYPARLVFRSPFPQLSGFRAMCRADPP